MNSQETQERKGTQGASLQQVTIAKTQDSHRPRIHITGSEALVWNVQDVKRLRQDHRIVGSLAGSLPRSPMQNIFQGLPLRLQPEEVYALWSRGLVDLVDEHRSYLQLPAASASASASAEPCDQTVGENVEDVQGSKTSQCKGGAGGPKTRVGSTGGADGVVVHTRSDHLVRYSPHTVPSLDDICMGSTLRKGEAVSAASTGMSNNTDDDDGTQQQQQQPAPWKCYPGTKKWQQRMVFMHFWASLQFYLAPGMKFGGDYLLYRNDPLVCHASLIASVKDKDEPLSLTDLASSARLASTVQKLHLLCSVTSSPPSSPPLPPPSPQALPFTSKQPEQEDQGHHHHHQVHGQGLDSNVVVFAVEWAGF
ncbi:tRNA-splicing endonuclease subunit Sen34 [Mortierella alpina]|nr:tRNA-splicing endonuclease subunit Sen34 [Mortierella alpina]